MDDDRQPGAFYILLASVRIVEKGGDAMRHRTARILMAPGLAGFSLFYLLPLGMTCFYAFVRSPFDATFVALDNLAKILMNSYFQMALQHTAFFTLISVGTVMLLSVFLTFSLPTVPISFMRPSCCPFCFRRWRSV